MGTVPWTSSSRSRFVSTDKSHSLVWTEIILRRSKTESVTMKIDRLLQNTLERTDEFRPFLGKIYEPHAGSR
jgi:hypothetical protein